MDAKKWSFKCLLLVSGMAFWVLSNMFSQTLPGAGAEIVMNVLLAVIFFFLVCFLPILPGFQRIELHYLIVGTIVSSCLGASFYYRWSASSQIQVVADMTGVSKNILVTGGTLLGTLVAVPFMAVALKWLWEGADGSIIKKADKILSAPFFITVCMIISLVFTLVLTTCSFSKDIWFDEAFSLAMTKHDYAEMIALTAVDVHPPIYYIILKFFVDSIYAIFPGMPSVYVAKIVSLLPHILLIMVSASKVRKGWGNYVAGVFSLAVVGMPALLTYSIEIRMYSWGMLFVTLAYLCANDIVYKNANWFLFVLFSLCAAYTHYFACVAVSVSYILLLIWFCFNDKKRIRLWCITAAVTVAGYAPWLLVLVRQLQVVSSNYWIPDITFGTVINYFSFMTGQPLFLIISGILVVIGLKEFLQDKTDRWQAVFAVAGILTPVMVIFVGTIVSVFTRPIFVHRYMIPGLGCMWLGILALSDRQSKKKYNVLLCVLVVLTGVLNTYYFAGYENDCRVQSNETVRFLESQDNAVYIADDTLILGTVKEMSVNEKECYFWQGSIGTLFSQVFGGIGSVYSAEDIQNMFHESKIIYYISREGGVDVEDIVRDSNLNYVEAGSYRIPEYTVKIYQIISE